MAQSNSSFRLASDRDYRRGVILGLTLAEVLLLLVFLLLLAAGALFARVQARSDLQASQMAELKRQLRPLVDKLTESGYAVSDVDDVVALIRRGQEAEALRNRVAQLQSALSSAEGDASRAKQALEQAQQELAAARLTIAQSRLASSKAEEYDQIVQALGALPGGNSDRPVREVLNRLGQYQQAMQELARLKGNGSGLPFCWVTPSGQPIYMLRFELHDDGFVVREEEPRPRSDDEVWKLLANLPRGVIFPPSGLGAFTAPLTSDAERRKCRYAVDVLDRTNATNKAGYRHLNYLLDIVFARHEING